MTRLCQVGSRISSHARYDFRRNSSIHAGSSLMADRRRMTLSSSPGGKVSASTSVSKPYLYSRDASCSMVSVDVDMSFLMARGPTPALITTARLFEPPLSPHSLATLAARRVILLNLRVGPHPHALITATRLASLAAVSPRSLATLGARRVFKP